MPFLLSLMCSCIGQKFALMEAALILAIVVPRFDILSHTPPENDGWGFIGTMKPVDFKCSFSCVNK
jgi:cytochrome P450